MSELINNELSELRRICESSLPDSTLVTCVQSAIRVVLKKTDFKQVTLCLTFPVNYPSHHILVEVKSKTLANKLLDGLVHVTETEAKRYLGKPHCLQVIKFVDKFLQENPLVCCSEEISNCKKLLSSDDMFKLSQKNSSVSVQITNKKYYIKTKIKVPHNYPEEQVIFEEYSSNFPRVLKIWFLEQGREIARRCVQPPLKKRPKDPPFKPRPSLQETVEFLIKYVKRYPDEKCSLCNTLCLPEDPEKAIQDENSAAHVERVYCSHCYHHDCLILYMKTPPFTGGKKCKVCGQRIYHEKWKVTPELAEARWAHEQAKNRELGEVKDFFGDLAIGD